uniref:Uncharacterized protein n=1 Tax=mine drainage metagenome TaxID=410659 RepID=E6QU63_9ZZZZ
MQTKSSTAVFPAPAGMNRVLAAWTRLVFRVPRACGDEPIHAHGSAALVECSPRLRG